MSAQLSDTVRLFLEEKRFAILATVNPDGTPQQTVIWYDLDGDEILMNSTPWRVKTRNLSREPRASICVEDGYTFVTIHGTVRLVEDQETAHADILRLATRYHGPEKAQEQMRDQFSRQHRVSIRLRMERVVAYGLP